MISDCVRSWAGLRRNGRVAAAIVVVFLGFLGASAAANAATGPDLALGRPVVASSVQDSSYPASAAVDGDLSTRWSSAFSDPQWIYVDLGADYNISEVVLNWEVAYAAAYQIQVSNDAVNWTTIYSTTSGTGGVNDLTGLSGTGRYVRMYGTARGTEWGYSLWEMSVYDTPTSTTSTTTPPPTTTTTTGVGIRATPLGVPAPSGGWSLEYGDAFGAPLGTGAGQDNTLFPNRLAGTCGNEPRMSSDQMEVFNCSADSVNSNGLNLTCSYTPGVASYANYTCGAATTEYNGGPPSGYKLFNWRPGQGQEWAFEINAKFPPNTGEADPGWWTTDFAWTDEIDFFEGFGVTAGADGSWTHATSGNGWIGTTDATWIYNTSNDSEVSADQDLSKDLGWDPSAGFHTYTTVFFPNNTYSEYIDGKIQSWDYVPTGGSAYTSGGTVAGPPPGPISDAYLGLELSFDLRNDVDGFPDPYFTSGTRSMTIRSIGVYENTTADGAYTSNPGLAPGTTLN